MTSYKDTPTDLPVPTDDGACNHLAGNQLPNLTLSSTSGPLSLQSLPRKTVLFIYPATGTPGAALPEGWNDIPGARGCTPESNAFKAAYATLLDRGWTVYGMSAQSTKDHEEAKERLELPYTLISDADFALTEAWKLPTFHTKDGKRYMTRVTLLVQDRAIKKVIYPVFPTSEAANMVLKVLEES